MSIFSKIAEFVFGPTTQVTPKVEVTSQPPVVEKPEVAVSAPAPAKKTRAKKDSNWLDKDINKPTGTKAQTSTAGKTVRKSKAAPR